MIPTDKSKNFFDDLIGSIHVLRLTRAELQRLVLDCPLPILSERGASTYSAPMWERQYKEMVRSGKIGAEGAWYKTNEEESDGD